MIKRKKKIHTLAYVFNNNPKYVGLHRFRLSKLICKKL